MLVWVVYDIVENRIRKKVSDSCKNYGLYRVQKSVFLGDLNSNQRDSLALECEELVDIDVCRPGWNATYAGTPFMATE